MNTFNPSAKQSPEFQIWMDEFCDVDQDAIDAMRVHLAAQGTAATMVRWTGERFEHTPITMADFYDLDPSNKTTD